MRLLPSSCGCDNRREIIFDAGKVGLPEATIIAASLLFIVVAWRVNT